MGGAKGRSLGDRFSNVRNAVIYTQISNSQGPVLPPGLDPTWQLLFPELPLFCSFPTKKFPPTPLVTVADLAHIRRRTDWPGDLDF